MVIGIDLGTTNSAAAYIDKDGNPQILENRDGERVTPSVIIFEDGIPLVGSMAKSNSISDPYNVVQFVKRQLGNKSFKFAKEDGEELTTEELSAIILKRIKEDSESILGEAVEKAVITVPAYFDDAQRKATKDAGEIAGLEVIKIINEPTAAALAYGIIKSDETQNIVVYDLGGGTFDVTVMKISKDEIEIKATGGDKNLGGFDFDNCIIEYVINKIEEEHEIDLYDDDIALQDLREKAEAAKKMLSSRAKAMISIVSQGKAIKVDITKEMFEGMIRPLINRTMLIMNNVIEDSGLSNGEINKILLVGGSTRIKSVEEAIERELGIKPSREVNPDEVVAIGAAYQGYILNDEIPTENKKVNHKIYDVNSHSLGVIVTNEKNQEYNQIILKKNTKLPSEASEEFSTMYDNQEHILLRITEGEDEDIEYVNVIGKVEIKLKKRPKGSPIKVVISYDNNSIIHVNVIDLIDNDDLGEMKINRTSNLSEEDIIEKRENISKMIVE